MHKTLIVRVYEVNANNKQMLIGEEQLFMEDWVEYLEIRGISDSFSLKESDESARIVLNEFAR